MSESGPWARRWTSSGFLTGKAQGMGRGGRARGLSCCTLQGRCALVRAHAGRRAAANRLLYRRVPAGLWPFGQGGPLAAAGGAELDRARL
jgi:hypothetical protein